jgi:hypothetical protein
MPYKSEKQRKYFHAHLANLSKGSKEYNKWKKVVDKFDSESSLKEEEINFNSRFGVKNKFIELTNKDLIDLGEEIINLINNAYKYIGGHFELREPKDLLSTDLTYWIGNDNDEDPNSDVVIGGKDTKFGTKLTTIGQDGTSQSKAEAIEKLRNLLRTNGFYVEADPHLASKIGLSPITDEDTIKNIVGKSDIVFNTDGSYQRDIKGYLANKVLVGIPKYQSTSPMNEIFKSLTSLQNELNEQNKVNIKQRNLEKIENYLKIKRNKQK